MPDSGVRDPSAVRDIPEAEVREELDRILASSPFQRSARLTRFLSYIVDKTLRGEGSEINEYLIGSEVFDRGPDYSPAEDSVVRRQAHSLRQKLDKYYRGPGKSNPVRIEVPVGHYVPKFRRLSDETESPAEGVQGTTGESRRTMRVPPLYFSMSLIVAALLAFGLGWIARRGNPTAAAVTGRLDHGLGEAAEQIWGPWLTNPQDPLLCFSNPMTTVIKHYKEILPDDSLPRRFLVSPKEEKRIRERFNLAPAGHVYMTPSVSQTKMGEAAGAVRLANFLGRAGVTLRPTQSRFLSWEDFRRHDLILLGHTEANRWLKPILKDHPLTLVSTHGPKPRRIINRKPRKAEKPEYAIKYAEAEEESTHEYALVSMLPGLDVERKLLLINGLNTQATQMAIEFLTERTSLENLVKRLQALDPGREGPWHFQMVLETEVRDKVPTGGRVVLLRII